MPKIRPPRAILSNLRWIVWNRDKRKCVRCKKRLEFEAFHLDHIISGKYGTNKICNLRTLCPTCHVLRACHRHQGMISNALATGIVPVNWRELVWEDDNETIYNAMRK
ncbi:HNH endonuclease [Bacillus sp. MRMR6]|uniref:HNH endonuclease n=1 Tax=Bacillus sp. MRMR6 TaxID=1928617 RepID=UPI00095199A5|nr:HNH endonuclease signature motif containing protein [Bacillus sp. MRMR6]OLS37719.1 HNH endonuclease [Bacillus sp. MRMR6]